MPPSVGYGDGPPRNFAVWKKSGGQAGGTQERSAAPTARSGENTQASACSGRLGVGAHFTRTAIWVCLFFGAKEVQITDGFIAAELEAGLVGGAGGGSR